ncbi:hypothetical protein vseg_004408 [Gypsophila vaccaria]
MSAGNVLPLKKPPAYSAPAPNPQPRPTGPVKPRIRPLVYRPGKRRRSCCRVFCCCLCVFIVLLVVTVGVAVGILIAWFQPKLPIFKFRPLELTRFNVTGQPDGTALLDSKAIVRVEAKNPNGKLRIYYGDIKVSLTLDEETQMGSDTLPRFMQPAKNVTILKVVLNVDKQVIDSSVGSKLKTRVKNENVEVNVEVKTKVGIGIGNVKIGMLPVNINCGGIKLKQLDNGKTSPKCTYNTLRWITIH